MFCYVDVRARESEPAETCDDQHLPRAKYGIEALRPGRHRPITAPRLRLQRRLYHRHQVRLGLRIFLIAAGVETGVMPCLGRPRISALWRSVEPDGSRKKPLEFTNDSLSQIPVLRVFLCSATQKQIGKTRTASGMPLTERHSKGVDHIRLAPIASVCE